LEKVPVMNDMIQRKDNGFTSKSIGWPPASSLASTQPFQQTVIVPLPFWFARGDPGCCLPIDAMTHDEVRCGITFRALNGLYYTDTHVQGTSADGSSLWPITGSNFYAQDPALVSGQTPIMNSNKPVTMPNLVLGDCYVMAEYVYLDQNEANRFRLADLQVPVVQHYIVNPVDTQGLLNAQIRLDIPNPTRDLFFYCQPYPASSYNAHFLATRDLTGTVNTLPNGSKTPWWPDAVGLSDTLFSPFLRPAFSLSNSEPLSGYELSYQGTLVRFRTEGPALFRSILPSYEQRKSPWVNRYYYNIPLGIQNGFTPFSRPRGEANLDKMTQRDLILQFRTPYGNISGFNVGRFTVYVFAETYNILRVYGGRGGMLFAF